MAKAMSHSLAGVNLGPSVGLASAKSTLNHCPHHQHGPRFHRQTPPHSLSVSFSHPKRRVLFRSFASQGSSGALTPQLKATLDTFVTSNKVVLFMKGTKDFPQCGFSNTVVQILRSLNVPFDTFNILENELLRQGLKEYSNWPTFPQLYIDGEFFGGCDITVEAYKTGELQELLEKAMCS